jgi:hypothetical protein
MIKKINFEKRGLNLKTKILVFLLLFMIFEYLNYKFWSNYTVQSPILIKFQSPIIKKKSSYPYKQPTKTSQEGAKFGQILAKTKGVEEKVIPFNKLLNEREYELRKEILKYVEDKLTENQIIAFDNIIKRESGYNPTSKNDIGAGGLCQAYPYEKMGCELKFEDWKCQVDWCLKYIENRYKNPIEAWKFHLVNNWF